LLLPDVGAEVGLSVGVEEGASVTATVVGVEVVKVGKEVGL
jgi:hypothetical protein